MTKHMPRGLGTAVALAVLAMAGDVYAEAGFAMHAEGYAARMVGEHKSEQFGWGGGGFLAPELSLGQRIGMELALGAVALTDGTVDQAGLVPTEEGLAILALPGVRLRPFGRAREPGPFRPSGVWLAAGVGLAYTGGLSRGGLTVRLGYDLFADRSFRFGPTVSWLQIIEPQSSVRPEDARLVMFGLHGAYESMLSAERTEPSSEVASDRDGDGIVDMRDACPDTPEDIDQFEDEDGCPELDNDKDTILDGVDRCRDSPEDFDGHEDTDGCPDPDNDHDGLLDKVDKCPDKAEDFDGFEDQDGCPDEDNDGDGILDGVDKCPDDPETVNGYVDDDGCPDVQKVRVVGNEIVLDERVYFQINQSGVEPRSWSLLKGVAKLLNANQQFTLIRVQGHADDTGAEDYNKQLSARRSAAVRDLLVGYGVDGKRLVTEAYGESRPSQRGRSIRARQKNRRVEFLILKRVKVIESKTFGPSSSAPPKPSTALPKPSTALPKTSSDAVSKSPEKKATKAPAAAGPTVDSEEDAEDEEKGEVYDE